jgi:hypothetical protein
MAKLGEREAVGARAGHLQFSASSMGSLNFTIFLQLTPSK